jgi:hypothetical protein
VDQCRFVRDLAAGLILGKGSQIKIRPRLRIESNQANNPPIVENVSLSLFSKARTFNALYVEVNAIGEDDMSGEELYNGLIEMLFLAEAIDVQSVFEFLHNKQMLISIAPNINITSLDPEHGVDGVLNVYLEYLPL